MSSDWISPCGVAYRWYDDGRFEIQGADFPSWSPTGAQAAAIAKIWGKWAAPATAAAKSVGCPVSWLVAIMYIETKGESGPKSFAPCNEICGAYWKGGQCASQGGPVQYCAGGLMAFTSGTATMYGKSIDYYVSHPEEMLMDGADLLVKKKMKGSDILSGVKAYNGGGPCSGKRDPSDMNPGLLGMYGQNNYVEGFVRAANTFVSLGLAPVEAATFGSQNMLVLAAFGVLGYLGFQYLNDQYNWV